MVARCQRWKTFPPIRAACRGPPTSVWLALFAPRSQLVEFVLTEDRYRRRMIDEIDADYWVAPSLRSGATPLEPTQQGGVKQLGVIKPWSPSRSYGLIARLVRPFVRRPASTAARTDDGTASPPV